MMKNYNFNGMNAHEIAKAIIAAEEAYRNTDYASLSFEDKCRYALAYTPIVHPIIAPDPRRRAAMLEELRPELLRRAQNEDGFALYVLGSFHADASAPVTDAERSFLERSFEAGYAMGGIALVDLFLGDLANGKMRKKALHEYLIPALNSLIASRDPDPQAVLAAESLISKYETSDSARLVFYGMARRLATDCVCGGSYRGLPMLCNVRTESDQLLDETPSDEEICFWVTVDFLVYSRLYELGLRHIADYLACKLINARGCDHDAERAKDIYVDLLLHSEYNRERLSDALDARSEWELAEAERICRQQLRDGVSDVEWRLVLLARLSGDAEKLAAVCDEICTNRGGRGVRSIAKAYWMLRRM